VALVASQSVSQTAGESPVPSQVPAGPSPGASSPPTFTPPPSLLVSPDSQLLSDAQLIPPDLPPAEGIDLGATWTRSRALVASLPEKDWRTVTLADALDADPLAAFAWVRDSIGFDPYAGELRGPAGALAARAGNSIDRALLLKRLLDLMDVPSRLVRGTLDDATANALVQRAFSRPRVPLSTVPIDDRETASLDTLATRARRDYALLRGVLGDRVSSMDGSANAAAVAASRDHFWVQMAFGAQWLDLDPTLPDAKPGDTLTAAQSTSEALPDGVAQTVTIRVLAETLSDGHLSESPVLDRQLLAADAAASEIYLSFGPAVSSLGGTINGALGSSTSWEPYLQVGADATTGTPFPISPGTDIFSGTASAGPQVSRLTLEVILDTPGLPSETHDSVLLDRVPEAARASSTIDSAQLTPLTNLQGIPVDFVGLHHIQVSTGGFDARAHEIWRGVAARLARLEVNDPTAAQTLGFPFSALPATVGDEVLVMASESFIRMALDAEPGMRAYVARPRVYLSSLGPTGTAGQIWLQTDFMADGVQLLTGSPMGPADAAARQVWYAALQTALETQLMTYRASAVLTGPINQTGASLAMGEPLTVLGSADAAILPGTASPQLLADLRAGFIAVVPGDPAMSKVWWRVDPATGTTRSVVAPGYGGQLATGTIGTGPRRSTSGFDADFLPQGNYVNGTVNTGPGIFAPGIDEPIATPAQIAQAEREAVAAVEAQKAPPPQGGCGGSEYTVTFCVLVAAAAFTVLGIFVYIIVKVITG